MAIAYDNASSNDGLAPTNTFSHTIGSGSDRLLVIIIASTAATAAQHVVSACTYNGVSATLAVGLTSDSEGLRISIYYLHEASLPAAGSYNVSVTIGGSANTLKVAAMSYTGVASSGAEATNSSQSAPNIAAHSTNITSVTDNALIVDGFAAGYDGGGPVSPAAPQTERADMGGNFRSGGASDRFVTTAGSYAMEWDNPSTWQLLVHSLAVFTAAGGAAPATNNALFLSAF